MEASNNWSMPLIWRLTLWNYYVFFGHLNALMDFRLRLNMWTQLYTLGVYVQTLAIQVQILFRYLPHKYVQTCSDTCHTSRCKCGRGNAVWVSWKSRLSKPYPPRPAFLSAVINAKQYKELSFLWLPPWSVPDDNHREKLSPCSALDVVD